MNKFESFLKGKTAKVPNWAWVLMVGGALGLGLYLKHKSSSEEPVEEELGEEGAAAGTLESYEGTEAAGGLAGMGLGSSGTGNGGLTPVESPVIPEGFTDVIQSQGDTIKELAGYIEEHPSERVERETVGTGPSETIPGGGPPTATAPRTQATLNPTQKATKEKDQNEINSLNGEIQSLNGEIQNLSNEITTLTQNIKSAKAAKKPNQANINSMESKRNQDQSSIAAKRAKVAADQAKVTAIKARLAALG